MQNYLSFIVLIKKYQCKRTTKSKQQRKIKTKLYDKRDDFTFPMVTFLIHQYYYCSSASVWSFHFKTHTLSGADPGFQVRGGALKNIVENCWDISCEKLRFYAKKSYFFQLRREARKCLGYFVWKITILRQKIIFFSNFRGARPLDPPLVILWFVYITMVLWTEPSCWRNNYSPMATLFLWDSLNILSIFGHSYLCMCLGLLLIQNACMTAMTYLVFCGVSLIVWVIFC